MSPSPLPLAGKRVYVAGHAGMVGSALCRRLAREGCVLITAPRAALDLTRQEPTEAFLARMRPDVVFVAAARVGGIHANRSRPADFLYENLAIATTLIHAAAQTGVERLVNLGSSCIYPRLAPQPMREDALLTGPLEPTNEAYAVAKIAGLKLAEMYNRQYGKRFVTAMPTNLYGPGDDFALETSHVIPALIRKIHAAKVEDRGCVTIWGSGAPRREFLHVDDLADALVRVAERYAGPEPINVGSGREIAIGDLARLIARVVGYDGGFVFDTQMPDGAPRKLLDCSRMKGLGWRPRIALEDGLAAVYAAWAAPAEEPALPAA